jgi:hypothetical protein
MLNRKTVMLAGAAMAALPMAINAAVVTYSYDLTTFQIATAKSGPWTTVVAGGTGSAATLAVPAGDFIRFGLDASISGSNGGGISQFTVGFNDSAPAYASVFANTNTSGTVVSGVTFNSNYTAAPYDGQLDGAGGINPTFGTAAAFIPSNTLSTATLSAGTVTPVQLFTTLRLQTGSGTGSSTLTVLPYASGTQYVTLKSGTFGTSSATYQAKTFGAGDSFGAAPTLTVTTLGSVSANKIISLTSSAPTGYGSSPAGSISITGQNGYYTLGSTTIPTASGTTGYVVVSAFSPATDKEVYALQLSQNGSSIATTNTTLLSAIVADINASETTGVTASLVTGSYTSTFPGYDILLTANPGIAATDYLGFDFSQDTTDKGITVTGVAAVPEPATAAGLVLGAAGLLLSRRKNKSLTA